MPRACLPRNIEKTKKRKVWSDGAVKCCPRRQKVCLHRWSEVLGVTDKLLGEIYLSVPEYEAFVSKEEPELEMEVYVVSFDGVIEDEAPDSTDAIKNSAGLSAAGVTGRKRKLPKPFKPPTRRAPPLTPADDAWGLQGRVDQAQDNVRNDGEAFCHRGAAAKRKGEHERLPARTSYTGFGHVESLWNDEDPQESGLGLEGADTADWGIGNGATVSPYGGGHDRALTAMQPFAPTCSAGMSNQILEQDDQLVPERSSNFPFDCFPLGDTRGDDGSPYGGQAQVRRGGSHGGTPRFESHLSYGDGGPWPNHAQHPAEKKAHGKGEARDLSGHCLSLHEPETGRQPSEDRNQARSTQDILSLFGNFEEAYPMNENRETPARGDGQATLTPLEPHHPNETLPPTETNYLGGADTERLEQNQPQQDFTPALSRGRAADMRRAKKIARAATAEPASKTNGASSTWACEVCGVRGSPSSISCRVCGAKRQAPRSDLEENSGIANRETSDRGILGNSQVRSKKGRSGYQDWEGNLGKEDTGDRSATVYSVGSSGLHSERGVGHIGSITEEVTDGRRKEGAGDFCSISTKNLTFSQLGDEGWEEAIARSTASKAVSNREVGSIRMQMDLGSSSDSDNNA